ncbi:MAG TPA: alpha/beta hydrolase-fold protein [Verrucomicrobiae bacterium]|nr:alpha/beta hydrolase-fold protein [Verrucomicrobiae bacterium]
MKAAVLGLLLAFAMPVVAQQASNTSCQHTVTGQLQVFRFDSKVFQNTRMLRIWLPPGYDDAANRAKQYRVLYMFDGQTLFDACTADSHEWQIDETLTRLIAESKIEPIIVVGIDNAGERREQEYLPWRDVIQNPDRPEPDGKRMPEFLLHEVMPMIEAKYRIAKGAENTGIGGSSYGALAAVYITLQAPGRFGRLLAESLIPWAGNGQIVRASQDIALAPERAWFGVGGKEAHYPGLHMTDGMRKMIEQIVSNFRAASLRPSQVQFTVDPEGGHNEESWAKRFPDAILFLFGHAPSSSAAQK